MKIMKNTILAGISGLFILGGVAFYKNSPVQSKPSDPVPEQLQPNSSKADNWIEDIQYLDDKLRTTHVDPFHQIREEDWNKQIADLKAGVVGLDDIQIIVELMRLTASIGDGHTLLIPPFQGRYQFHQIPIECFRFQEGVYIRSADSTQKRLFGKKVIKVGDTPMALVEEKLLEVLPQDMGNKYILNFAGLPFLMSIPEILYGLGIIDNPKSVDLTLEGGNGQPEKYSLPSQSISMDIPRMGFVPGWLSASYQSSNPLPLYLKNRDQVFWYEYLTGSDLVYCQINQIRDSETQTLREFSQNMFELIESKQVKVLVIDLRHNNGGNNQLNQALVDDIVKSDRINQPNRLFVIIGNRTFSAAANLVVDLENQTEVVFVGTPTGTSPNHYGDNEIFTLPNSELLVQVSTRYWQKTKANDKRKWVSPDLKAQPSIHKFINNQDVAFETILNHLNQSNTN